MFSLPASLQLGAVSLRVSQLDRSLHFYQEQLGFRLLSQAAGNAALTTDGQRTLVRLTEAANAHPRPRHSTGLFHFAILLPSRLELARSLAQLGATRTPLDGASDHGVSEALYLSDPDGNGIELYRDRPRGEWPQVDGRIEMHTAPLDLQTLLAEAEARPLPWAGLPAVTTIGHIHLHVSQLAAAEAFYRKLGFDLIMHYGSSAAFLSAGGYHHHIGINTWAGVGAPPPPATSSGLVDFVIELPDADALAELAQQLNRQGISHQQEQGTLCLQDPAQNRIRVVAADGH